MRDVARHVHQSGSIQLKRHITHFFLLNTCNFFDLFAQRNILCLFLFLLRLSDFEDFLWDFGGRPNDIPINEIRHVMIFHYSHLFCLVFRRHSNFAPLHCLTLSTTSASPAGCTESPLNQLLFNRMINHRTLSQSDSLGWFREDVGLPVV